MKKDKEKFMGEIGISEKDEKQIKSLVEEAFKKSKTVEEVLISLSKENKMDLKTITAGFLAGIMSTLAIVESGKIPLENPKNPVIAMRARVNMSNNIIAA